MITLIHAPLRHTDIKGSLDLKASPYKRQVVVITKKRSFFRIVIFRNWLKNSDELGAEKNSTELIDIFSLKNDVCVNML